jgi:tRNA G26 N,N-dimethylase Trm1
MLQFKPAMKIVNYFIKQNLIIIALVCCTFTDLKVLSGPDYDKCFYYYGANKSKVGPIHEVYYYTIVLIYHR